MRVLGNRLRALACAVPLMTLAAPGQPFALRPTTAPRLRVVVVVFDGLRPDHITPARMPTLDALATSGVRSLRHHALFPTVTRVNASALTTGAHPAGHGILDNSIYLPTVDSARVLNTGEAADMMRAQRALDGHLLTAPSLPARLASRGRRVFVASAGSSGSAYLLAGAGAAYTANAEYAQPSELGPRIVQTVGAYPADASPNLGRNAHAVDALLRMGVDSLDVDVAYLWLSDPDHTAHGAGLGSVAADSSIRAADRELGRLLSGLAARGLREQVDVLVVSDHGFSTHDGDPAVMRQLFTPFARAVTVAGSVVHVREGGERTRAAVVQALQASPMIGAIFTAPARMTQPDSAVVPGTLSTAAIDWQHPRAGEVLFSADWSHAVNKAGHAGLTHQTGVAGHGTTSPYDIRATLVAAGPHVRVGATAPWPSSNADIVPTILHLLGEPSTPPGVTGRPLLELLRGSAPTLAVVQDSLVAAVPGYRTVAYRTRVGTTRYLDSTRTTRTR